LKVLILSGTTQAKSLAEKLAVDSDVEVVCSLAGATRAPFLPKGEVRIGGFGGVTGLSAYLTSQEIDKVVDATHPFAAQMSANAVAACEGLSVPFVQVLRPAWTPTTQDNWTFVDSEDEVANHVSGQATVFIATGRQTLHRYGNLAHATLICRQIDPPSEPFPYPKGQFLVGRPPFSVGQEIALFTELKVDVLVTKNAGGAASASKLEAARELGIPVILINRPTLLDCARVETVDEAIAWLQHG
jgi:precorrin-6A/cobalt-precorrin-6A reductase